MDIVFATHNQHKSREIKKMVLQPLIIKDLLELNFNQEIPETGQTLRDNALEKSTYVHHQVNQPVFADDTGFEVDALSGAPGVYSARYAGLPKDDKANLTKLLNDMTGKENRTARFRTVICFIEKNQPVFFEGVVEGHLTQEPRGIDGFGYDPAFIPEGYNLTFAEMPLSRKNQISHRSKAFRKFIAYLRQNYVE